MIALKEEKDIMLVITRKPNEEIKIGLNGEITVTVVEVRGNQVRLGIDAERSIPVHRKEVYDQIQDDKKSA